MNKRPKISIIGSSIRDHLWEKFFVDLNSQNEIDFEIVFTGSSKSKVDLPSNFKYIFSETKPAQCVEISARNATGDLLMVSSDDLRFNENFLDHLYDFYKEKCKENDFVSSRFRRKGYEYLPEDFKFWGSAENSPLMPMNLTFKKEIWHKLGGIDKNFIGLFYDLDLALRLMQRGGKNFLCEKAISEEIFHRVNLTLKIRRKLLSFFRKKEAASLFTEIGDNIDRPMLNSLWVKKFSELDNGEKYYSLYEDKVHVKNRIREVESFSNIKLKEISQGPKARWN